MIEYIDDETVYKLRPHGNSKNEIWNEYHRTVPSVLKEISNELSFHESVSSTYTSLVRECPEPNKQGVMNPRNHEQVRNVQNKYWQKSA